MDPYKILFAFPTRSRKDRALMLINRYMKYIDDKENFHMNICCDNDDPTMNNDDVKSILDGYRNLTYYFDDHKTKIEAVNSHISDNEWDIVIGIQDDLYPVIMGFDNIIRKEMKNAFIPDLDGVLFLFDGYVDICTIPCMGRVFYNRTGYVAHPGYKSLFADNDLTELSKELGKLKRVSNMLLQHKHPTRSKIPYDALYAKNDRYWDEDEKLYNYRKDNGFFLEELR